MRRFGRSRVQKEEVQTGVDGGQCGDRNENEPKQESLTVAATSAVVVQACPTAAAAASITAYSPNKKATATSP